MAADKTSKKEKYSAKKFGIEISVLPDNIRRQAEGVDKQTAGAITREYESVLDYYAIYYTLKFERQLSNHEISRKLNKHHAEINHTYESLHWDYGGYIDDFESCENERELAQAELQDRYKKGMEEIRHLDISKHPKLIEMLNNTEIEKFVNKKIIGGKYGNNFVDCSDFIKQMYYFYCVEDMSFKKFCQMFGFNNSTCQGWLHNNLGIRRTQMEGQKAKAKDNPQNYDRSGREGRKTTLDSQHKHHNGASAVENELRGYIVDIISDVFQKDVYDVVVGCNSRSNLQTKEIDIPIWIQRINNERLYKFVFEYNGNHDDNPDKVIEAIKRGWIYTSLRGEPRHSSNPKHLRKIAKDICDDLFIIITNIGLGLPSIEGNMNILKIKYFTN